MDAGLNEEGKKSQERQASRKCAVSGWEARGGERPEKPLESGSWREGGRGGSERTPEDDTREAGVLGNDKVGAELPHVGASGPAASALPRTLAGVQILRPHPRPIEPETPGQAHSLGPGKPPRGPDARWSSRVTGRL